MQNIKSLSERDICTKFITPALQKAGWDLHKQILEEVLFTDCKIYVRGKLTARGERKRADYILYYHSLEEDVILTVRSNGSRELVGKTVILKKEFIEFNYAGYLIRPRYNSTLINLPIYS
jgi:hypothetical protein